MLNAGQVVPAESLIDAVWGPAGGDRAMLKQLVYRLRQKIEADPSRPGYVQSVAGAGYTFEA
jgi:DNA-binding response OmpR family regulator